MLACLVSLLICLVTGSAAHGQEKPLLAPAPPHFPTNLKGVRIKLERTSCLVSCPDYSVTIYGDGTFVYEGHRIVKVKGKQEGQVPIDAVRELVHRFFSADYFSLTPFSGQCGGDAPTAVTSIEWPGASKKVTDCGSSIPGSIPAALVELESAIDATVNSRQWIGTEGERRRLKD
jgi:hypothetical protein